MLEHELVASVPGPPRVVMVRGRVAWLDADEAILVHDRGEDVALRVPVRGAAGIAIGTEGTVLGIGVPLDGAPDVELVEVQPNGERTRGFAATQLVPGEAAWLFAPRGEERDTWVCSADEDATLERVPLGRAGDVTAALALGVLTPDAMARLEDGRFLVAGLGYFVRVTAPRVRGEGGEIEALAQASWPGSSSSSSRTARASMRARAG